MHAGSGRGRGIDVVVAREKTGHTVSTKLAHFLICKIARLGHGKLFGLTMIIAASALVCSKMQGTIQHDTMLWGAKM